MAVYQLEELLQLWAGEKITAEQAIGQLLLHYRTLAERVGALEKWLEEARQLQSRPERRMP